MGAGMPFAAADSSPPGLPSPIGSSCSSDEQIVSYFYLPVNIQTSRGLVASKSSALIHCNPFTKGAVHKVAAL